MKLVQFRNIQEWRREQASAAVQFVPDDVICIAWMDEQVDDGPARSTARNMIMHYNKFKYASDVWLAVYTDKVCVKEKDGSASM